MADEGELLGNYAFNISQGILQRVSRFIDALTFVEEDAESGRGGVMGFGHKRNVLNLVEKAPARRVAWDQQRRSASRRRRWRRRRRPRRRQRRLLSRRGGAGREGAALEAKVAEMQALAALCSSAPVPGPPRPSAPSIVHRTFPHPPHSPTNLCLHHLSQEQAARR